MCILYEAHSSFSRSRKKLTITPPSSNLQGRESASRHFLSLDEHKAPVGKSIAQQAERCGCIALMTGRHGEELDYLCRAGSQCTVDRAPVALPRLCLPLFLCFSLPLPVPLSSPSTGLEAPSELRAPPWIPLRPAGVKRRRRKRRRK